MKARGREEPGGERRLVHICRGLAPPLAVAPADVVVDASGAGWRLATGEPLSDADLVELLFAADAVVAW